MDNQITDLPNLSNQGATGYLDSLLQVLYMTKDFKSAVERHSQENPDSQFIDRDLDALFKELKTTPATPNDVARKLRIDRVNEPRDAADYFEKILHVASPEASKIFNGILTHRNLCLSCKTEMETDSPFWLLPLALANFDDNHSVLDGINELFEASFFSGDDQIYCDCCCAKSDFRIDCVMKQHPDVLLLLLKRFELDHSSMKYVKNNCNVDIPFSLQIPTTNRTYELYAVVDHKGDLRNGHYTASIKDGEDWYHFYDATVTLIYPQQFQVDTWNAYLLFYKKQNDCKALPPPPTDNDVYIQCGDTGKKSEKIEVVVGVGHEVEEPGTDDLYSDGSSRVGSLDEKNKVPCAQMSVEEDMYRQYAELKQSEKRTAQTEREEHGENRATHPRPTTSDPADLAENTNTLTLLPNKRRTLANLGGGSHQSRPALEINDNTTERTEKLTKVLFVKIIEEEIRPLKDKKVKGPKETTYFHSN